MTITEELQKLIDQTILELNPGVLDDDIEDALQDWDNIGEATDYLIEKLEKMKEEL